MNGFAVGDVVEVLAVVHETFAHMVGQQSIVVGFVIWTEPDAIALAGPIGVRLALHANFPPRRAADPRHLRKVNPPDWSVPVTETEELSA